MVPFINAQRCACKAQAQRLKAKLKVGWEGLSPQFLRVNWFNQPASST
jgi:hypothetical protein